MEQKDDRSLSAVFLERAEEFLSGAAIGADCSGEAMVEPVLHFMCCALELSLKAVILLHGGSDERNRVDIRHSLTKALAAAERVGFRTVAGLAPAARRLSPHYEMHSLHALATTFSADELSSLVSISRAHIQSVRTHMTLQAAPRPSRWHGGRRQASPLFAVGLASHWPCLSTPGHYAFIPLLLRQSSGSS